MSISGSADVALFLSNKFGKKGDPSSFLGDKMDEKQKAAFFQQVLAQATATMNANAVKNGIEDVANRLKQNGSSSGGSFTQTETIPKANAMPEKSSSTLWSLTNENTNPEPVTVSNNTPSMQLNCTDCGMTKMTSEDMEIHIKIEHLNWLPFQCPICLVERASDAQMREHLHSSHKKSMNKFIYVDNKDAKIKLQLMMDKAFSMNVTKRVMASTSSYSPASLKCSNTSSGRTTSQSNGNGTPNAKSAASVIYQQHKEKEKQNAQATADFLKLLDMSAFTASPPLEKEEEKEKKPIVNPVQNGNRKRPYVATTVSETSNPIDTNSSTTDDLLASINMNQSAIEENEENDQPSFSLDDLNIDSGSALASLFGGSAKKIKYEENEDSTMDDALDALNPISVLDNVAALFGAPLPEKFAVGMDGEIKKPTSSVSKKRVLGECSKCQKPVTAGARQMHMFFHLAKDENIFRFRCKHDGCNIEHYRKDQMENHQSKIHGRIEPEMMEDRSLELFQKCQELNHELFVAHRLGGGARSSPHRVWSGSEVADISYQDLSMELLGTKSGTIPGPTAAKAEIAYAAQQAANAQRNAQKSKSLLNASLTTTTTGTTNAFGYGPLKLVPDEDHPLQCRQCGKTMQNRIRGFHILWHMAKDKGINRYTCKHCNFGHDRSQSVQVHGKKEHGTDDCVEDRIGEYQDDVKEMSEACFGISSLFAQESKRKNKIPAAAPREKDEEATNSGNASPLMIADILKEVAEAVLDIDPEGEVLEEGDEEEDDVESAVEGDIEGNKEETEEDEDDDEEGEDQAEESKAVLTVGSAKKKKKMGRFNLRSKKSKKQKEVAVMMRTVSLMIGGAQFYKKKVTEFCYCEKCGKMVSSKFPEHAYTHIQSHLFVCPICDVGHHCRDTVMKHLKDMHPTSAERCVDVRLLHVEEIKKTIKECFPAFFVDQPLPTKEDVEKLLEISKSDLMKLNISGIPEYLAKLKST